MKFSYNWLKELVLKLPKPDKLADLLNMHAFEVESLEKQGSDTVLDIAVLPNRIGDASGHIGMARDIAAILGVKFVPLRVMCKEPKQPPVKQFLSVALKDKKLCRRYMSSMIIDVNVKESPQWLRYRLDTCGLRSINNIVDATNYTMLLVGQPLHAFDYDKLAGHEAKKTITVRTAGDGEHITTLDGTDVALRTGMLIIADDDTPLAIAGIRGGKKAEITNTTTRVVLEAATFDNSSIRRTSQIVGLRTDSAIRFSVGLSASLVEAAMEHACVLIEKIADGVTLPGVVDIYPKKEKPVSILLRHVYVNSLLGTELKEKDIKTILTRLGCKVIGAGRGVFCVTPPLWRRDIAIEEDLIEEVGRIPGFETIQEVHPLSELIPPKENDSLMLQERARDMLMGIGFRETYSYSFVSERDITVMGDATDDYLRLENPPRDECMYMRASLGPNLLKAAFENLKHEDVVRLFEMGNVFRKRQHEEGHSECVHVAGVVAEKLRGTDQIFFELKGALSLFFEQLGVDAGFYDVPSPDGMVLHPHRSCLIKIGEEKIGIMGELHPRVLAAYGMNGHVALFEIDADVLGKLTQKEMEFRPVSRYPSVMRDIALLVPLDTRMAEVEDVIENTGGELLVDTDLVDIYAGPELPDGKKNFAFRLVFQASDRTLTDEEVNAIVEKITKALEEANEEWEVRK